MRSLDELNYFRVFDNDNKPLMNGHYFEIRYDKSTVLKVIADIKCNWEHVTVSIKGHTTDKIPTWYHMKFIKEKFFYPYETCIQYHPSEDDYIDKYEVLHIWRNNKEEIITPPKEYVL